MKDQQKRTEKYCGERQQLDGEKSALFKDLRTPYQI